MKTQHKQGIKRWVQKILLNASGILALKMKSAYRQENMYEDKNSIYTVRFCISYAGSNGYVTITLSVE